MRYSKDVFLGRIFTAIGFFALILAFSVGSVFAFAWLIELFITIFFLFIGVAYLTVFVRKDRTALVLVFGAIVGLCFLLMAFTSLLQIIFALTANL